jgi:hypothetical protein
MNTPLNKSVTLVELLIALTLIGLVVLGFSSIDLFSRFHVTTSDRRIQLQNDVATALEHMTKQISRAIGNTALTDTVAVKAYADNKGIRIRIDDSPANGYVDANDTWIAYRHENIGSPATDSEIRFYPNAGSIETPAEPHESIAHRIVISSGGVYGVEFSGNFDVNGWLLDNILEVKVSGRWNPAQTVSNENPEVTLRTRILMPAVSTN